jgi:hypothetical protein
MRGPHDTSPPRLRQIAEDLQAEGWYTIAGTIWQVAEEKEQWERQAQNERPQSVSADAQQGSGHSSSGCVRNG